MNSFYKNLSQYIRRITLAAAALSLPVLAFSQAQVRVTVNSGTCSTTCTDGFIGGAPEPHWRVNIDNQGWTTYPSAGICFTNPPNVQYTSGLYYCSLPATIQVCFRAFEDDGATCIVSESCLNQVCQNYPIPAPGSSATYTLSIPAGSSTGNVNFTIQTTGALVPTPANDNLCNAQALTLGTITNGNNTCATVQAGEVDPADGAISPSNSVWYSFVAPPSGHVIVSTDFGGTTFDTEIAVYGRNSNPCPGTNWGALYEVGSDDDIVLLFNENSELELECLIPGNTYYVQVDGNGGGDFGGFQVRVQATGPALPTYDNRCSALNLGNLTTGGSLNNNNLNNFCGTIEPGEPNAPGCIYGIDQTMWFTFTTSANPGVNTMIAASNDPLSQGDQIDLQLALYQSSNNGCTGTFSEIDCDYDPGFFAEDLEVRCLQPNTTYFLQVDGSGLNTEGFFGLNITDDGTTRAPNNLMCSPTPLGTIPTLGSVTLANQNNYCADVSPGEPDPLSFDLDQTVWYTFQPPPSGSVEIELLDSGTDDINLQVAVWETSNNTCTGFFAEVDSYDDALANSITGTNKLRITCLDPTKTYWIQVDGWTAPLLEALVEGDFTIRVYDYNITPAPNDSICFPIFMGNPDTGPISVTNQNNFCADNILDPIPSAFGTNQTVWYTFIAPSTGRVQIDAVSDPNNTGNYIDLQLAVYGLAGNVCTGAPTEIHSEYNDLLEFPPLSRDESMDVFCLEPGRMYWLMVDGSDDPDDVDGLFNLTITEEPGPPPITNDNRCTASALGAVPNGGSVGDPDEHNFCATVEAGEPVASAFGPDRTVWYTFVAPPSGNVTVTAENDPNGYGDQIDLQLAVYESSNNGCTGTFTEVNSDYDPVFFDEDLTVRCLEPGRIYYLQVDGALLPAPLDVWAEGYFSIEVNDDPPYPIVPTNDDICNRIHLGTVPSGGSTAPLATANFCATTEAGEPNVDACTHFFDFVCDETVWFTFTTGANPGTTTVAITGTSGIDANVHVYQPGTWPTCNFADLTLIGTGDDILSFNTSVTFPCLDPNSTYYVQVDGNDIIGDEGTFTIAVTDNGIPNPAAPNDNICAATSLGVIPASGSSPLTPANNFCASEESGEPNVSGNALITDPNYDETVWFYFTTSANPGLTTIAITGTTTLDASFNVYASPNCTFSNLVFVDDAFDLLSNNVSLSIPCLSPNTRYYIQVDGNDLLGNYGNFNIQVTDAGPPSVFPTNDNICAAQALGVVPAGGATPLTPGDNRCATEQVGEPHVSGGTVITDVNYDETVWYTFTTPATPGLTTVTVTSVSGIDADIHVYGTTTWPTCAFNQLVEIAGASDAFTGNASVNLPCLNPNTTYYVQVDGTDAIGDRGLFNIRVSDDGNANFYAPNDDICSSVALGLVPAGGSTATYNGSNYCASEEPGEPGVSGSASITSTTYDETVWFTFTTSATPGTTTVDVFNTTAGGLDASITVYRSQPFGCNFGSLTAIRSATTTTFGNVSLDLVCLEPNTTYYIQLDGVDLLGDYGPFSIRVRDNGVPVMPPTYNNICFAQALGNPNPGQVGPFAANNNCANIEAGEPNQQNDDETVWFTFIAPNSGRAEIIINSTAFIDANFNLYYAPSGGCTFAGLQQVGGNHDNLLSFSVSYTEECLVPGGLYYVQVDGNDILGDYGNFTITIRNALTPFTGPSNDPCSGAIPLTVQNQPCYGSGNWQVFNYGTPTVSLTNATTMGCGDNCGDLWYSFVMPPSGNVLIEGNDEYGFLGLNNSEINVTAYSGPCGSLTPIACESGGFTDDPAYYISGTPGQTYYLQVFDDGGDDINELFGLCVSERCGSDDCLYATQMVAGVNYCFDTDGANGESTPADPGYNECGDGSDPGHSVYFTFTNRCPSFTVTVQANIGGICLLGEPTDGLSVAIYQDPTLCDDAPVAMLDCQQTDVCLGNTWFWQRSYGVTPGTQHVIQIDGFDFTGDDAGIIRFDETCVLPAVFLRFSGYHDGAANQLLWKTNTEAQYGTFHVLKSTSGSQFSEIGVVDGAQHTVSGAGELGFTLADMQPTRGHNYYQLRHVDWNGLDTYSEVIDVYMSDDGTLQVLGVYPNPAREQVNIDFYGPAGTYMLTVIDMYGHVFRTEYKDLPDGITTIPVGLDNLSAGMYMVSLQNTRTREEIRGKFVKQ